MLYKQNGTPSLPDELFQNPTSEYRGTPFWAWNDELTADELHRQIAVFREMGFGGFHMHVRTGLKNQYLSPEYMELVRSCVDEAKSKAMLAWLYDEDRWPSGAAGGIVTADVRYRARCLHFSNADRSAKGTLLACYDVLQDPDGNLLSYRRIGSADSAGGQKWYATLEVHKPEEWYNNKTYVDTLNPDAIRRFVEVTHEAYRAKVGDEFGETVPAIFTDEPQFSRKGTLRRSFAAPGTDVTLPWTDRAADLYRDTYGADPLDTLPELFWERADGQPSVHRYRYHDFIAELFASSFADVVGGWCRDNGILLTGHMMEEPTLHSQTAAIGDTMRSYRSFGLPGIDLLCNSHEFTTAKQAQSAAHQFGREGVLSELYGVTGWDCDFRTYKHQGDWQAALGITVRVPHLSWYSMRGEAKRDYPASISYQSCWYKRYPLVEDHFARLNTALTRGRPLVKIGVIHPVESFWLHWGPNDKTGVRRRDMDDRFQNLTKWLLTGTLDFDFIDEAHLPAIGGTEGAALTVGAMKYDAVVVPGCETLRSTTLALLEKFRDAGGKLLFVGDAPTLENAVPSERGAALYARSAHCEYARAALLDALSGERFFSLYEKDGSRSSSFVSQLRQDGDARWLFLARAGEPDNPDLDNFKPLTIVVRGEFAPVLYDTATGEKRPLGADYRAGNTEIRVGLSAYDSLLLRLEPGRAVAPAAEIHRRELPEQFSGEPLGYDLSEPNVLVLDRAEYRLDDGDFAPATELLRLDNACRRKLGWPDRGGHTVQPWAMEPDEPTHTLTLRFRFASRVTVENARLSLEDADKARIVFNGEEVSNAAVGWYVDPAIVSVALPTVAAGENVLEITLPFGRRTNTENVFVTGEFGVTVAGDSAYLTAMPESLTFGDLCTQGFPFYGGALTYHFRAVSKGGQLTVRASRYRAAVMTLACDGKEAGPLWLPPYTCTVDGLADGEHDLALTVYLGRFNTFGAIHNANEHCDWQGPTAWRTDGDEWSEDYVLHRHGVLAQPTVE